MKKIIEPNNFKAGVLKKLNEKRNFIRSQERTKEIKLDIESEFDKKSLDSEYQKFMLDFNKYNSSNVDFVCYLDKFDLKGDNVDFADGKFKKIYNEHIKDMIDSDKKLI